MLGSQQNHLLAKVFSLAKNSEMFKPNSLFDVQDAIAAVTETVKETGGEVKEEVTASIQGAIDGISEARRQKIAETQSGGGVPADRDWHWVRHRG